MTTIKNVTTLKSGNGDIKLCVMTKRNIYTCTCMSKKILSKQIFLIVCSQFDRVVTTLNRQHPQQKWQNNRETNNKNNEMTNKQQSRDDFARMIWQVLYLHCTCMIQVNFIWMRIEWCGRKPERSYIVALICRKHHEPV